MDKKRGGGSKYARREGSAQAQGQGGGGGARKGTVGQAQAQAKGKRRRHRMRQRQKTEVRQRHMRWAQKADGEGERGKEGHLRRGGGGSECEGPSSATSNTYLNAWTITRNNKITSNRKNKTQIFEFRDENR